MNECAQCNRLQQAMREAEQAGDRSKVTDCVVLLRRHPEHGRRPVRAVER
jgi:hypothetical protein